MNRTCAGGSSRVLSRALKAAVESMCTSSTMYTLERPSDGEKLILSRRSRTSSTLVFEAASISIRSRKRPSLTASHGWHRLQGRSAGSSARQLTALARIRAVVGLPVRRGPANRRSEEHTSELQSHLNLGCRLLLGKKNRNTHKQQIHPVHADTLHAPAAAPN